MATGTIKNAEYYQSGETFGLTEATYATWVNNAGTSGIIGITLPKKMKGTPSVSATLEIRGQGGGRAATIDSITYSASAPNILPLLWSVTSAYPAGDSVTARFSSGTITFS